MSDARPIHRKPDLEHALGVGDRVRLSERGRKRAKPPFPPGVVTGVSATGTSYRVRWGNQRTAEFVHWTFLERDDT